jgi:bacterioferritin (cytochrome b1)
MNDRTIDELNHLLRGEMSAVETYSHAFDHIAHFAQKSDLVECQHSHQERVQRLRQRILQLGGAPAASSGAWGAIASAIERGAAALGDKLAIRALEEGEGRGLKDYKAAVEKVDGDVRALIESELLPEQVKTHQKLIALKTQLH